MHVDGARSTSASRPQTASSSCSRENTRPGCRRKWRSRRNSVGPRCTGCRCATRGGRRGPSRRRRLQRLVVGARAGPAHHRAQPGDELARAERLGDVIVGAAVEAAHLVGLFAARGQHDDRQGAGLGERRIWRQTSIPETSGSIQLSSTEIGLVLGDAKQRLLAVARLGDGETFPFEIVAQAR